MCLGKLFLLRQICKDWNKMSFDNIDVDPNHSLRNIITYSSEITEAFISTLHNGNPHNALISWIPPSAAGLKFNTDGC